MKKRAPIVQMIGGDPFFSRELADGVMAYAARHGPWRFVFRTIGHPDLARTVAETHSAGLLGYVHIDPGLLEAVQQIRKPVVRLGDGKDAQAWPSAPIVIHDDPEVGRVGAEHLLERRYSSYAYLGPDMVWSRDRERGFFETLTKAGVPAGALAAGKTRWTWFDVHRRSTIIAWLRRQIRPIGIMACNDGIGSVIAEACESIGLRMPEEVGLVAVDNHILQCEFTPVPISSIELDHHLMGYRAAEMLDRLMSGQRVPENTVVRIRPKGVVARRSTELPLFAALDVDRAFRFIREHAVEGISVEDVVKDVSLSRRTIELRFRQVVGRSIDSEIRRVRLELARDLIERTDRPTVEIAARCGLGSISYLSQAFKKAYGKSPRAYRYALQSQRSGTGRKSAK